MADPGTVPSYVPSAYRGWVSTAAQATGLPASVVAAQIRQESGFQPSVRSSAGAVGIAQFLPSTYASVGGKGDMTNAQNQLQPYINYMNQLLQQKNGNVAAALAAYNAGPAAKGTALAQGQQYARTILSAAGQPTSATATPQPGGGSGASASVPTAAQIQAAAAALGAAAIGGNAVDPTGAAGAAGAAGAGAPETAIYSDKCLISTPDVFGIGGSCILSKAEGRVLLGGALMTAGGIVTAFGIIILAAYGLRRSGAMRAAGRGLQAVGGAVAFVAPEVGVPVALGGKAAAKAGGGRKRKGKAPDTPSPSEPSPTPPGNGSVST